MHRVAYLGIWVVLVAPALAPVQSVEAADLTLKVRLEREIKAKVPNPWQVHVTWREDTLLAFVTPYPYQEAFDLWYKPEELRARLLGLCPGSENPIWQELRPEQDIAVEPTVGGKGDDALRLTCPRDRQAVKVRE